MPPRKKRGRGAAEHAYLPGQWGYGVSDHRGTSTGHTRPGAWDGLLAFANIGLPGAAVSGSQWTKKHRPRLDKLVTDLFHESQHCDGKRHELNGILLNEVGNLSDLLDKNCKKKFDDMMTAAFERATGTKPYITWSDGETMAAFRDHIKVESLPRMHRMYKIDSWRTVERFLVYGATEHGSRTLLVYNQHQPSSPERPFPTNQRVMFCKHILDDAIEHCKRHTDCCGFVFGGDANCNMAQWTTTFNENHKWKLTFEQPQFLHGVGHKPGDLIVAAAVHDVDLAIYENRCKVKGREQQHVPMFCKWSCRPGPLWRRDVRPRTQEPDAARGSSEPASGVAPPVIVIDDTDEKPETHILVPDEMSSRASESEFEEYFSAEKDGASECSSEDSDKDEDGASEHSDKTGSSDHDDEDGAPDHSEAPGDGGGAKHFDDLESIGVALAKSIAASLPELSTRAGARDCLDAVCRKPMIGTCTEAEKDALMSCLTIFFTRRPVLETTPPRENGDRARVMKSETEIQEAWEIIMQQRRRIEPDDKEPITDPEQLAWLWRTWQREWFAENLTPGQRKKHGKKTSIWNAWCFKKLGGGHFVIAVWQTGILWAPPPELLNSDFTGAVEHVVANFARWTRRLARSVACHKAHPKTVEARTRSGRTFRQSPLTEQQRKDREERRTARRNYYMTIQLAKKVSYKPSAWVSHNDQWWLHLYHNGVLRRRMREAEAKCHKVEAPRKRMLPDEIS